MTQPELTAAAQKNLDAGAVSGAGTSWCKKCEGPKEDRRLNSFNCVSCDEALKEARKPPKQLDQAGDRSIPKPPDPDAYAVLVWIVRSRLVLPEAIPMNKARLLTWARENGYDA